MCSLTILIALIIGSTIAQLWAIARVARAVGSPRGRMGVALVALLAASLINVVVSLIVARVPALDSNRPWIALPASVLVSLMITFIVFERMFKLSFGRTFAPLGASIAVGILTVGVVVLIIRPRLTEAFVLPTRSMMPTLNPGDRFCVSKVLQARRWDLVAFWNPGQEHAIYCKRVIALPGERLRFDDRTIYINDQAAAVPAVLAGRCHASTPSSQSPRYQDGETITLGAGEYFLVGDNIDISGDSRHFGPVAASAIVGIVDFVYWPPAKMRVVR